MNTYIFGMGAAGNKATLDLVEMAIINTESFTLFNTNKGDIPQDQYSKFIQLQSEFQGGAAKDPAVGRAAMQNYLADETNLQGLYNSIPEDVDFTSIITSVEGGTGSGAAPVLAKCIADVFNIPVHLFVFIGFHNEEIGMNNTIEFMKELISLNNVTIHIIQNDKFNAPTYKLKEKEANKYVGTLLNIIKGENRENSTQNIDDADAYKLFTTPGIMGIVTINCSGRRSKTDMNAAVVEAFDSSVEADYGGDAKRLAMILNASEPTQEIFDDELTSVRYYTNSSGGPEEIYRHIQYDGTTNEYCVIVAAGMSPSETYINYLLNEREKLRQCNMRNKSNSKALLDKLVSATNNDNKEDESTEDSPVFIPEKTEMPTIRRKKRMPEGSFRVNRIQSSDNSGTENKHPDNPMNSQYPPYPNDPPYPNY